MILFLFLLTLCSLSYTMENQITPHEVPSLLVLCFKELLKNDSIQAYPTRSENDGNFYYSEEFKYLQKVPHVLHAYASYKKTGLVSKDTGIHVSYAIFNLLRGRAEAFETQNDFLSYACKNIYLEDEEIVALSEKIRGVMVPVKAIELLCQCKPDFGVTTGCVMSNLIGWAVMSRRSNKLTMIEFAKLKGDAQAIAVLQKWLPRTNGDL